MNASNLKDTTARINLKGALGLIQRSKFQLAPLLEAITNSLEAISQRQAREAKPLPGLVEVRLYYTGLLNETNVLESVEVSDNGVGFDDENFERFETLLDKTKGFNNRGSGRIQYLHRAGKVEVSSNYNINGQMYQRTFECDSSNFISKIENNPAPKGVIGGTKLTLSNLSHSGDEKDYFENLDINSLKNELQKRFLLRMYLDKKKNKSLVSTIKILFFKQGKEVSSSEIKPKDIPDPLKSGKMSIPYLKVRDTKADEIQWVESGEKEELEWAHFKLPESELDQNGLYLCSKNVPVEGLSLKQIKKTESVQGNRFLTAIYGALLDREDSVSHSVDSFKFPYRKEVERQAQEDLLFDPEKKFILFDSIEEKIYALIPKIYGEVLDLEKRQEANVKEIARAHGINERTALAANINLSDTEAQITDKIYKRQAETLSKENQKIKHLYESLSELNPTDVNYQDELEKRSAELLALIPQQNKEELSRYVIRREMVTDVLKKILSNSLATQKQAKPVGKKNVRRDKEGLIHDLIFKRKSSDAALNDLWILSEEYVHFDGCSDQPISKIEIPEGGKLLKDIPKDVMEKFGVKPERRPDIFLYPAEGKCILIELKDPDADLSDHLNQLVKYSNLIANFSSIKIEKFYCYLIGENINQIDLPGDYEPTINEDWVKNPLPIRSIANGQEKQEIAKAYIEVIKLSSIYARAHRRNKSFADKLGIRIDDIKEETAEEEAA